MFADSLLETSWAQRSRRGWSTLTSFGVELLAIGLLLLVPLWKTVGLPSARVASTPITAGHIAHDPGPAPTTHRAGTSATAPANPTAARFVAPGQIPTHVYNGPVDPAPDPAAFCSNCVASAGNVGSTDGLLIGLPSGTRAVPILAAPAASARLFKPSTLLEGSLIHRVLPTYPPIARTARIQGSVVLFAVISKAGTIENLRTVSGHPMLVKSALDAVSQWRYRPYILNDQAVEVETQITVVFSLN